MPNVLKDDQYALLLDRYYELYDKPGPYRRDMGYPCLPHEAMILVSLIYSEQPEVIFESGTAIGWSSSWMAVATDSPIITFDPVARDQVFSVSTGNITRVLGTFDTEIHKWAPKYANNKKMVFIDGDHGRSAVVADTMAVVPYLRPYDILIYHDTDKCGTVQKALHYDIIPAFPSWEVKRFATRRGMIALTVK